MRPMILRVPATSLALFMTRETSKRQLAILSLVKNKQKRNEEEGERPQSRKEGNENFVIHVCTLWILNVIL